MFSGPFVTQNVLLSLGDRRRRRYETTIKAAGTDRYVPNYVLFVCKVEAELRGGKGVDHVVH